MIVGTGPRHFGNLTVEGDLSGISVTAECDGTVHLDQQEARLAAEWIMRMIGVDPFLETSVIAIEHAVKEHMMSETCSVSRIEYASLNFLYDEAELEDYILIRLDWQGNDDWEVTIIDSSAFEHATALWCKVDNSLVFIKRVP
jgi:hypothetical protein